MTYEACSARVGVLGKIDVLGGGRRARRTLQDGVAKMGWRRWGGEDGVAKMGLWETDPLDLTPAWTDVLPFNLKVRDAAPEAPHLTARERPPR